MARWLQPYQQEHAPHRWFYYPGRIVRGGGPFDTEEEAEKAASAARELEAHIRAHSVLTDGVPLCAIDIDGEDLGDLPRNLENLGERYHR